MTQLLQPAPGWYPDPARTAELRYWDGTTWTTHVHPPQPPVPTWTQPLVPTPHTPTPHMSTPHTPTPRASWARRLVVPLALLLVFLLVLPVALYQWRLHHRPSAATPVGRALDPQAAAAALRVGGRPGQQLITPAQAGTVLAALWPLRERAIASGDTEAVRALESGSAEWGDVIRARGGEGLRSKPAGYSSTTFFVPRQTSYPGRFLAFVATSQRDGAPLAEAMVFVRASAKAAWTLDLDTAWTLGSGAENLPAPRVDAQGYLVAPSASLDGLARRAPSQLVAYWQQAKDQGRVPPPGVFAAGAWTTDRAAYLSEHPNGTTQSNGLPGVTRVSLGSSPFRTFLQADGADIACGVVWTTSVNTRGSRGWPYQDDDRSNWGPEVAPGLYREMRSRYQWQTCFFVPPAGLVRVLGGQGLTEALTTGIPLS